MTKAVKEIRKEKPLATDPVQAWDEYNGKLASLVSKGSENEKKDAIKEILDANSHLIGRYVAELNFTMYSYCEFEDAYHIVYDALADELQADGFNGIWDALLWRKVLFRARRKLHNAYRSGGINISYSYSRDTGTMPTVTSLSDLNDANSKAVECDPEVIAEVHAMQDLVREALQDAEYRGMLSPLDRAILIARYSEGRTFKEIAEENDMLENSVSKRTRRILDKLQQLVLDKDPGAREYLM